MILGLRVIKHGKYVQTCPTKLATAEALRFFCCLQNVLLVAEEHGIGVEEEVWQGFVHLKLLLAFGRVSFGFRVIQT